MTCKHAILLQLLVTIFLFCSDNKNSKRDINDANYYLCKVEDFAVNGLGDNDNWEKAEWTVLSKREQFKDIPLETKVKMLYSDLGLYFLFYCQDHMITATMDADFMDLWNEDVVEVFLWPDESRPVYFEYEISPLNYELPIIVANINGTLLRWKPFHYEENRHTEHKTSIIWESPENSSSVKGWIAEFFIPYSLLIPLVNTPPEKGDSWRANFYRLDYDLPESISWLWQMTTTNFHEYDSFGTITFN